MNNRLHHLSKWLLAFVAGVILIGNVGELLAQNKVTLSILNRRAVGNTYYAEAWATITSTSSNWQVGNTAINLSYNTSALTGLNVNPAMDADATISGGGYDPIQQQLLSGVVTSASLLITFNSGAFTVKNGGTTFRIATFQWSISNPFAMDNLAFRTAGFDPTDLSDGPATMGFNCGNNSCFGVVQPAPRIIGEPVITQQPTPTSATVCAGLTTSFTVSATGNNLTYQWQKFNGVIFANVGGQNSPTLNFSPVAASDAGTYRVQISNTVATVTSNSVILTVNSPVAISQNPASQTVCQGSPVSFTVAFTGTAPVAIQWQVFDGATTTDLSGQTSTTLTIPNVGTNLNGNQYSARLTNVCGTITSSAATLTVNTAPIVNLQPNSQAVCAGATATFQANANGTPTPTMQWEVSTNGGGQFLPIVGATSSTLNVTSATLAQSGNQYRATFTNVCGTSTSSVAILTVNASPAVTSTPANQTVCEGGAATFTATATGTPTPTIQWQVSTNAGLNFTNITNGAGTPTYSGATSQTLVVSGITIVSNNNQYRAIFTNICGSSTTTFATLTVNTAPVVTLQPQGQSVCAGNNAVFTATASGSPVPTVQWQLSTNAGVSFTDLAGQTATTLTVGNVIVAQNGNQYRAVFTNICSVATSAAVTLTVNTAPVVTSNPSNQTVCEGGSTSFTAAANGTPTPTIQWQLSTNAGLNFTDLTGQTGPTLTLNTIAFSQNGNQYRAVFTNVCGTSNSSSATLTVNTAPVVTTAPQSQSICVGNNATFTVAFTGSPIPTVQWQVSTNAGLNFTDLAGQTTPNLTVSNVTTTQSGNQYRAVLTNVCSITNSVAATLTVNTAPVVTTNPVNQTVCSGNNATFTAAANATPAATIQWQVSVSGGTFTNLGGQTNPTLTLTAVALSQNGNQYRAVFTNTCGSTATLAATLTVNAGPVVTTNPASQTICAGNNVTFSASATGTPAPTIQWQVSTNGGGQFTDLAGQTSPTLTLTAVAAGQNNNQYRAAFTNTCGTVTSLVATLTVNVAPVVTINPASQTVCSGTTVAFTANATATPAATVQWQVSVASGPFADMAGQNTTTLTLATVTAGQSGNQYRAVFTNTCGSSATVAATLTVNVAPVVTINPASQTVCSTATVVFTANATATPAATVQWQVSVASGPFTDMAGQTTTTLTLTAVTAGQSGNQYRAVFTNTCGSSPTIAATLTVNVAPVVTANPSNQTVCAGNNATFTASASGIPTPTVQWQVSTNGGANFAPVVPPATNTTYTFVAGPNDNGNQYRAVFTNTCGTATTVAATLNFFALPAITQQPTAVAVCQGQGFSLTVVATGTGLTYQWRKGNVDIIGANSATYSVASASVNDAGFYTVVVSNICNQPVVSNQVDVFVNNPAVITSQPVSQTVCLGSFVQFTVQATGTGLTYQWRKGTTDIPGATNTFYIIQAATLNDAGTYTVVISGVCPGGISSNPATLTVNTAPVIASNGNPTSVVVCEGQGASFSVTASGSNLTYQWQFGGVNISGANSSIYTIPVVGTANAGTYTVIVTGSCPNAVTSLPATLTVNTRPRIVADVQDMAVCQGRPVTFTVNASGTALTYQWRVNTLTIPGATGSSYTIPVVSKDMAANYDVVISGLCQPAITSRSAALTVYDTVRILKQPSSKKICLGGNVLISISADGTGNPALTYQWYKDGNAITGNSSAQTDQLSLVNLPFQVSGNYSVVVTGICGSVKSQDAVLVVVPPPTAILKDPINKQAVSGDTVIFELSGLSAQTEGATFQWFKGSTPLSDNNHLIGTQSSKLIITNVSSADEANDYSVQVRSTICNITVTSVLASLHLYTVQLTITTQPVPDVVLCTGGTLSLNGAATTTKVGGQITYQWYYLGNGSTQATVVVNGNNPILTINNVSVNNSGTYYFVATETTSNPPMQVTSGNANVHVYAAPMITQQPQSINGCPGELVSLSVGVNPEAGPVTYQWFKDGNPLVIQGVPVTVASVTDLPLNPLFAGSYNVVVNGNCGTISSTTITVVVKSPTVITTQPPAVVNVNDIGGQVVMSVSANGAGNCTYQWKKDGVAIPGENNPTYTHAAVATDELASFTVEITCDCGTVTSNVVKVDIQTVGVGEPVAGERFDLGQNFPNPFDAETNIAYSLPTATTVRLVVTDTYGREVAVLVDGFTPAGSHTVKFNAAQLQLPSGAYFYTMTASGYSTTRHMLLVK